MCAFRRNPQDDRWITRVHFLGPIVVSTPFIGVPLDPTRRREDGPGTFVNVYTSLPGTRSGAKRVKANDARDLSFESDQRLNVGAARRPNEPPTAIAEFSTDFRLSFHTVTLCKKDWGVAENRPIHLDHLSLCLAHPVS